MSSGSSVSVTRSFRAHERKRRVVGAARHVEDFGTRRAVLRRPARAPRRSRPAASPRSGVAGSGGAPGAPMQHRARDGVHFGARSRQLALRALADLLRAMSGESSAKRSLRVVERRAETEVAVRFGQQALLQPDLLLRDRRARLRDRALEAAPARPRGSEPSCGTTSSSISESTPLFCFAAVSAWIFGTRAGSSDSRTCARKRGSSSSRAPTLRRRSGSGANSRASSEIDAVARDAGVDAADPNATPAAPRRARSGIRACCASMCAST